MSKTIKPLFRVGEVVRVVTESYSQKKDHGSERYQRITKVFPWTYRVPSKTESGGGDSFATKGFGYRFLNGDECHEKFIAKLTKRERGD